MIKFELEKLRGQALGDSNRALTPITHHFREDPEMISHFPEKESVTFKTGPPDYETYVDNFQDDIAMDEQIPPAPSHISKRDYADDWPIRPAEQYWNYELYEDDFEEEEVKTTLRNNDHI